MREVYLDDLPKYRGVDIDWKQSIGYKVKFIYDNIEGEIEIVDYDNKKYKVEVKYLNTIYWIPIVSLKKCRLSELLGLIDHTCYKKGDIIEMQNTNILILNTYRDRIGKRKYKCKCLKCGYEWNIDNDTIRNKCKCIKCSKNIFKLSEDGTYWIGFTQNNEEFWFNGEENIVNYIKSYTWRKTVYGYFQNANGEKLHRVVMEIKNPNTYINHIGGNKFDCRREMLSISNHVDNSREKNNSIRNSTGVIGLMKRGKNNKYVGNIKPDGMDLYSTYKEKDEAIIDLLIMQRHFGFRHNQDLWYILDDVSEDRIKEVLDNCERQINTKRNHSIKSNNKIELSEDKTFYWVYDSKNKKFKISLESKDATLNGIWYVAQDKNENYKEYVKGCIIDDEEKRKSVKLHRYLMNVLNVKYKNWYIDHVNGDSLDNRVENLEITDSKGNGHKSSSKGYIKRNDIEGAYRVNIILNGKRYDKTVHNEQEAIKYVEKAREEFFINRLSFKNKEQLDEYLNNIKTKEE